MSAHQQDSIYAYTGGRPTVAGQATLVFVHGAGHDHSVWNMPARHFAYHGFNVLAPDLPGHGRSKGDPLPSIEAIAKWLINWIESRTDGQVVLIGHSMGSLVALRAAAQHPDRVAKLVLAGSVAPMPVAAPLLSATLEARDKAHAMINQWSYTPDHHLGASAQPGMVLTGVNRRLMERSAPGVLHTDMSACNAYTAGEVDAARIGAPTRLICGERDQLTPLKATRALQTALAKVPGGAHIIVLPNAGHAMMAEAPDAFLDALRGFIVTP